MEKKDLEGLRWHLEKAFEDIGLEYGVELKLGTMRHDDFSFTATLKGRKKEMNGKSGEQLEFEKNCAKFNIPAEYYGKRIAMDGREMEIVGINARGRKYPVLVSDVESGERYKVSALSVIFMVNKEEINFE